MADPSQLHDQKSENYYRGRSFYQNNRPPYRGRGRGRGDGRAQVQRTLNGLGVSDLREHLDRLHIQDQSRSGPPSDPTYNYLRDPLRESDEQYSKGNTSIQRSHSYRGRGRYRSQEHKFIQNPTNIQIEVSTSTGQRNFSVNEDLKLADIKHIPDYSYLDYQEPRGRGNFIRGRGVRARGRGRFVEQNDQEQRIRAKSSDRRGDEERGSQIRSKSVEYRRRVDANADGEHRGRGRNYSETKKDEFYENQGRRGRSFEGEYVRGRFRGRGRGRVRGRGRGNHTNFNTDIQPTSSYLSPEENWDTEEPVHISHIKQEFVDEEHHKPEVEFEDAKSNQQYTDDKQADVEYTQEYAVSDSLQDEYYEDDAADYQDTSDQQVKVEENIVDTSTGPEDSKRRLVRFSLDEKNVNSEEDNEKVTEDKNGSENN